MADKRIFVSIDIPKKLKETAQKHIEPFYENSLARVTKKENWHITVVFCGYLTEEELESLKEKARQITKNIKKFDLTPDKIVFAPKRKPRMVWLTFRPSAGFENLSKKFAEFTNKRIVKLVPHSTLVRFKEWHYPNLKNLLSENGIGFKEEARPFLVESIEIMESRLSSSGPKYELLEKIKLQ
jgi:2'-5' RNA ligase